MNFYTRLLLCTSVATLVFNSYGMKNIKQYKKPIKNFGKNRFFSQKSGMKKFVTPKTQPFVNINKTNKFFNRPTSTIKDQSAAQSKSWLLKSWEWLKSKFITPSQEKTRSSFADLFFKNAAKSVIMQKRAKIEQAFLPVIESLEKGNTTFTSSHIKFENAKAYDQNDYSKITYYDGDTEMGFIKYVSDNQSAYLEYVKVEEEYRKYGIGKLLIKAALAHLKAKGVNKVTLKRIGLGPEANRELDKFYPTLGFTLESPSTGIYTLHLQGKPK